MGSTFTGMRCSDCMGALEYNKARKIWICPYCGKEYERDLHVDKVQIDGVAGINDTVRATLSDIGKYDLASAQKNLSEAERINPNHVGTIISNICYYLFSTTTSKEKEKQQQYLAKTTYYAKKLNEEYSDVYEDEKALYDYLNNPDLYAVLYIAFNSINNHQREAIIYNYLQIDSIVDSKLNKSLLSIALKKKNLEDVDLIVKKVDLIDKKFTLNQILKLFPDSEKKQEYVKLLFSKNAFGDREVPLIMDYLNTTSDSVTTKFVTITSAYALGMQLDITKIIEEVFKKCTNETEADNIFNSLALMKLKKDDVQIVLDYCLSKNCPNEDIAIKGLTYLKDSGGLFEVDDNDIIPFLKGQNFSHMEQINIVNAMLEKFNCSNKSLDNISSYAFIECAYAPNERQVLLDNLLKKVKSITMKTLNDYVLKSNIDKNYKPLVVEKILKLGMNKVYFNNLLSDYIKTTIDVVKVKEEIVILLMKYGLQCSSKDLTNYLLSYKDTIPTNVLNSILNYPVVPEPDTLSRYFKSLSDYSKCDTPFMDYLLNHKVTCDANAIERYLLFSKDVSVRKTSVYQILINGCINKNFSSQIGCIHNGNTIRGNIAQVYLLTSNDDKGSKLKIIQNLKSYVKLSESMLVNNKQIKFKKYITENKDKLEKDIDNLCEELGVYKLFF